jgi:hypothetical protein
MVQIIWMPWVHSIVLKQTQAALAKHTARSPVDKNESQVDLQAPVVALRRRPLTRRQLLPATRSVTQMAKLPALHTPMGSMTTAALTVLSPESVSLATTARSERDGVRRARLKTHRLPTHLGRRRVRSAIFRAGRTSVTRVSAWARPDKAATAMESRMSPTATLSKAATATESRMIPSSLTLKNSSPESMAMTTKPPMALQSPKWLQSVVQLHNCLLFTFVPIGHTQHTTQKRPERCLWLIYDMDDSKAIWHRSKSRKSFLTIWFV